MESGQRLRPRAQRHEATAVSVTILKTSDITKITERIALDKKPFVAMTDGGFHQLIHCIHHQLSKHQLAAYL